MRCLKSALLVWGACTLAACGGEDGSPTAASRTVSILGDARQVQAGTSIGDILSYRGAPAGEKSLEFTWDEGTRRERSIRSTSACEPREATVFSTSKVS